MPPLLYPPFGPKNRGGGTGGPKIFPGGFAAISHFPSGGGGTTGGAWQCREGQSRGSLNSGVKKNFLRGWVHFGVGVVDAAVLDSAIPSGTPSSKPWFRAVSQESHVLRPCSAVDRTPASHAGYPGSIPGTSVFSLDMELPFEQRL